MDIGIFGGSFNPIHNGHISLGRQLLSLARLDCVWFMVSPQNPLKRQSELLDDDVRMKLARTALRNEPRMSACDHEMGMPKPSYTWKTMRSLSGAYPSHRFTLIIGADNWLCFTRWRNHEELLANYPIAIYPRTGSPIDIASLPPSVHLYDMPLIDISSTDIRQRVKQGLSIDTLVPADVARIIAEDGLYA